MQHIGNLFLRTLVLALITLSCNSNREALNDAADVQALENLTAQYIRSVNAADTALAATVWETSEEVSIIHPMGHDRGWRDIKNNIYIKVMGEMFIERNLRIKDLKAHVAGNAGWVEFYWDFTAKWASDSSQAVNAGRESQFYIKKNDQWKLVHVHYSVMPPAAN